MIEGLEGNSDYVDNQVGQSRLCEHKVRLASGVNVARIAPSETRGQNWIQRQFRGEKKPSKHRFKSSGQSRRTSLHVRLSEVASFACQTQKHLTNGTAYEI